MRGCQEQTREGDLGGSPGHGWTGRPKVDNILLVRWGVTISIYRNFKYMIIRTIISEFLYFQKKTQGSGMVVIPRRLSLTFFLTIHQKSIKNY
jgi:hypothetical protein